MSRLLLYLLIGLGSLGLCAQDATRTVRPQQAASVTAERRLALVIGNDSYHSVSPLRNARADAQAIAATLEQSGFQVILKLDLTENGMKAALRTFKGQLRGGDVAVFYYSGHGVQLGGANYLLPVDIRGEDEVKDDSLPLQHVLDDLQDQKTKFALAIVDACRSNPFKGAGRAIGTRGLATTTAANGQMVLFSAGTGQEALDRLGNNDPSPNGLFTRVLLKEMRRPGVPVRDVLENVREEVVRLAKEVGHEQMPAIYDQALGKFYFVPGVAAVPGGTTNVEEVPPAPVATEMVGHLQVLVNAPGADVYVEGELKGKAGPKTPLNMKNLPVGEVTVKVEAAGYEPSTESLTVSEGKWTQAKLVLRKQSVSPQGSEFALIPAGSFQMGTNSTDLDWLKYSRPVHGVTISSPFWMAKTPVTVGQFRAFVDATGYRTEAEKGDGSFVWTGKWEKKADANWRNPYFTQEDRCPVVCVSWNDAQAYIQWLNGKSLDLSYRLPTEAEWEYACRAGTTDERYGDLDVIAWYGSNSGGHTHPVGQKQPNAFGLYDMLGHVLQWCQDWYGEYPSGSVTDPQGPNNGSYRVLRGGAWNSYVSNVRYGYRLNYYSPGLRNNTLGFRVVAIARTQ